MPPRYAYWTILIDDQPTAFRAREREELLPTFNQLARKNSVIAMKWFARGRLWDSPEAERAAQERPRAPLEKRTRDWRPGGAHKDPRARFDQKKVKVHRPHYSEKPHSERPAPKAGQGFTPAPKPFRPARPLSDRPWSDKKPGGPEAARRPWSGKPPSGDKRPWSGKPPSGPKRPWTGKPGGDRPWKKDAPGFSTARKPWNKGAQGFSPAPKPWPKKKRDDEPDKS